ncbi:unnamed protein product [Calypogeia fissa]
MAKKEAKKPDGKDSKEGGSKDSTNVKGDSKDSKDTQDAKSKSKAGDDKTKSASRKSQAKEAIVQEEPPPEDPIITDLKVQRDTSEAEVKRLREVLSIIGSGEGDLREAKIIDLFKKNRYLNLCLEKERNRASKMANQIKFLQEELLAKANEITSTKSGGLKLTDVEKAAEFWKDKHTKIVAKLQIVQARTDMLLNEIAKLQHIIKREVGEHIPTQKVLDEGGTWRGRAEQIALLKDQLDEANKKIRKLESSSESQLKTSVFDTDEYTAIEIRHRNTIDKINYERQKELDKLGTNYAALREHWQETKAKLDKTVARKNILEADIRNMKAKVGVLVSKSENDDLLINALTLELAAARQALGPPFPRPGGPLQLEHHYRCNKMAATLTNLKHQCSEQEKEIELQDKIIGNLRVSIADPIEGDWCTTELFESTNSEISTLDLPITEP